ncbi:MAG TPA: flagellar hook capping FlgD N-terminal domain-containing protein [Gemmatimonadaceae bacterium]|nr:flagellar hook capping FlgD N-terminal domain-containing protein [Gemmatimonadaceae bacterium]
MSDITAVGGTTTATSGPLTGALGPGGAMGKDEFLKMLVAQLQNQDPMNPMQGQDLAVQLAQFSSVEQLIQLNANYADQAASATALAQSISNNGALSAIGRHVLAAGDQVEIPADGDAADVGVTFSVGDAGGRATLTVYDAAGEEVGTRALGYIGGGKQTATLGTAAAGLEPGRYSYAVSVVDSKGNDVPVQTFITGTVDGVRYTSDGAVLTSGELTMGVGSVVEVTN